MRVNDYVACTTFPCLDVKTAGYCVPSIDVDPARISGVLISEAAALDADDNYYAAGNSGFARATVEAFRSAGADVSNVTDILRMGIYLTPAIKCPKLRHTISSTTIAACAELLRTELSLFTNIRAYLLMGDVAIKALNAVAMQSGERRVVPAGPTYKLRRQQFFFRGARVLPSYLQVGPSVGIEKGKLGVIVEDIRTALDIVRAR